ncbi:hypothetical protein VFPBJ_11700 [Purpureocillium lilacinum]|uniref:Uncharacterized protein n=1 Tax=Purpureocillium lilacinum TaxID=33203 RepID=A0A179EYA0_PURLI|nr:hypothetical protein VFPBJ_11700 [Purpureocillium lilacinum]
MLPTLQSVGGGGRGGAHRRKRPWARRLTLWWCSHGVCVRRPRAALHLAVYRWVHRRLEGLQLLPDLLQLFLGVDYLLFQFVDQSTLNSNDLSLSSSAVSLLTTNVDPGSEPVDEDRLTRLFVALTASRAASSPPKLPFSLGIARRNDRLGVANPTRPAGPADSTSPSVEPVIVQD